MHCIVGASSFPYGGTAQKVSKAQSLLLHEGHARCLGSPKKHIFDILLNFATRGYCTGVSKHPSYSHDQQQASMTTDKESSYAP